MQLLVLYMIAAETARGRKCLWLLMVMIILLAELLAVLAVFSSLTGTNIFLDSVYGVYDGKLGVDSRVGFGSTYNSVQMSLVMIMALGMLLGFHKKLTFLQLILAMFPLVIGIFISGSTASLLALVAMATCLLFLKFYRLSMGLFAIIFLCFGAFSSNVVVDKFSVNSAIGKAGPLKFQPNEVYIKVIENIFSSEKRNGAQKKLFIDGTEFRLDMHRLSIPLFLQSPLVGVGLGNFPAASRALLTKKSELRERILKVDLTNPVLGALSDLLKSSPKMFGYHGHNWTLDSLQEQLVLRGIEVSREEVRQTMLSGILANYSHWTEGVDAHSLYLSIIVELGLVGLILVLAIPLLILFKLSVGIRTGSLEDPIFVAGVITFVGVATIGLFWHIQMYRELAIATGFFIGNWLFLVRQD